MKKAHSIKWGALLLAVMMIVATLSACGKKAPTNSDPTSSMVPGDALGDVNSDVSDAPSDVEDDEVSSNVSNNAGANNSDGEYEIVDNAISAPEGTDKVEMTEEQRISILALKEPNIKEVKKDLKGREITVASFVEFTDDYDAWFGGMQSYYAAQVKQIEKDYNCKIVWKKLNGSNYGETVLAFVSGGIIPANIFYGWFPDLINARDPKDGSSSVFRDLRTVRNVNLAQNEWNQGTFLNTTFSGRIYGLSAGTMSAQVLFFNKTMAKKYNLGNLYDIVLKNQWTFDKFVSMCQEVYNKSNKTIYGCGLYYPSDLQDFVYANGTAPIVMSKGSAIFNGNDSKVLTALSLAQKTGVFNPKQDFKDSNGRAEFINGNVLFSVDHSGAQNMLSTQMTDDFGIIPLPKGPDTKEYIHMIKQTNYNWSLFKDDPNIEDSAAVMVALVNRCRMPISMYNEQQEGLLRDDESLDMLHYILGDQLKLVRIANVSSYSTAIEKILTAQQTPAQAMQAIQSPAKAEIDELYNKGGGKAPQKSE
ncbi:MAG: extracellular solute-binding protein [Clostridia bacterium]|nr:extracellular solute-binding protein [Clostridia bacterium]